MSEILGGAVLDLLEGRNVYGQRLFGLETRPSGFVRKALTLHIVCEGGERGGWGRGGKEGAQANLTSNRPWDQPTRYLVIHSRSA